MKKHQAEQAARAAAAEAALAKAKSQRDALTQRLKDIVNDALRANAARSPSVTDLAHANNMAMQAEAERLRLAKAEQKAREEAEAAEKALREAERQRDEIARQQAETAHLFERDAAPCFPFAQELTFCFATVADGSFPGHLLSLFC